MFTFLVHDTDISVRRAATVTRKRRKDVFYIQICTVMFLNNLQKRLKGRRKRRKRVNEEEEEKAKILKSTYKILDYRNYQ